MKKSVLSKTIAVILVFQGAVSMPVFAQEAEPYADIREQGVEIRAVETWYGTKTVYLGSNLCATIAARRTFLSGQWSNSAWITESNCNASVNRVNQSLTAGYVNVGITMNGAIISVDVPVYPV